MKFLIFSLLMLTFFCCPVVAGDLMPFKSDGCSVFPDGTLEDHQLWLTCCIEHDKAYWAGGTEAQRKTADENLKNCVSQVGHPAIADIMLTGVRAGGTPYFPTTFRWGYGWPYPRGYKELTKQEQLDVANGLKAYHSEQEKN